MYLKSELVRTETPEFIEQPNATAMKLTKKGTKWTYQGLIKRETACFNIAREKMKDKKDYLEKKLEDVYSPHISII